MNQFASLNSPQQQTGSFLVLSLIQFSQFILTNLLVWEGQFTVSIGVLVFFYIISSSLKMLTWITLSKIPNSNVKVTKRHFLLFALLIDFREAYNFDQCKKTILKQLWMIIYLIQFSSSYLFLFLFLKQDFYKYLQFDFPIDDSMKKLILFLVSMYIIFGITYGNLIISQYFAINANYPISIFRKAIQAVFIFSSTFSFVFLFVSAAYDKFETMIVLFILRLVFVGVCSHVIPKYNEYSRLNFQLLFPFLSVLPEVNQIQFIRNVLRNFFLFGYNIDISPTMMKISNIYDKVTIQPISIIIRVYSTLEVIGLLVYNIYFASTSITQLDYFQLPLAIVSVYLFFNVIYFTLQFKLIYQNCYPTISLNSVPAIESNEHIQENQINQSLIQPENGNQEQILQKISNSIQQQDNPLVQLEINISQQNLFKRQNQDQIISILSEFLVLKQQKSVIIIQDQQLIIDINKNRCHAFLNNLTAQILSESLMSCPKLNINNIVFSVKDQLTQVNKLKLIKAIFSHLYSIQKIEFEMNELNTQLNKELHDEINSFYNQYLNDYLQIYVFYQQISHLQIYNPYHIIYDLYDVF
ncbi:hypothetical protein ABPG74_021322 [Tetrahymena malaccensis]